MNNCPRCVELEQMLRTAEDATAELGQQLAGREVQLRRSGQAEVALRNELNRLREEEPEAPQVKALLVLWRELHRDGDKRVNLTLDGPRAKRVKWALKKYGEKRCETVIRNAVNDDWAMGRIRKSGGKMFNDIAKHLFKDEESFERFEGLDKPPVANVVPKPSGPTGVEAVLGRLEGRRQIDAGKWTAQCPAHEDRHASLSVSQGRQGAVLRCHAGCTVDQIAAAISLPLTALFDADAVTSTQPIPTLAALPGEEHLRGLNAALLAHPAALERLRTLRGWTPAVLERLGVGLDRGRLTFPIRDQAGRIVNVLRYQPNPAKRSGTERKLFAAKGRPRDLFPAPETIDGPELWLVEGEPDGVSGLELGLPASGLPGTNGFKQQWVPRFEGRRVVVCLDCDDEGRRAAERVAKLIVPAAREVRICDLDPSRSDGYDLGDVLLGGGTAAVLRRLASEGGAVVRIGEDKAA